MIARSQDSAAVTRDETNHLVDFLCESLCNARCCLDVARLFRPVLPVLYASLTSSAAANTNSGTRVRLQRDASKYCNNPWTES